MKTMLLCAVLTQVPDLQAFRDGLRDDLHRGREAFEAIYPLPKEGADEASSALLPVSVEKAARSQTEEMP